MQMLCYFTNFKVLLHFVPNVLPESRMVSINIHNTHFPWWNYKRESKSVKKSDSRHVINIDIDTVFLSSAIIFVTRAGRISRNEQIIFF